VRKKIFTSKSIIILIHIDFDLSRKTEADDGLLCVNDGDKADQGEIDVSASCAPWCRNGKEVISEVASICLPSLRTYLQVLCILPCGAHEVPSSSSSGKLGQAFRLLK
jgi:hypothetical protein